MSDFQIYVQVPSYTSVTPKDVEALQIGNLKRNNWNLPEGILVRILKQNLALHRSTALVSVRSIFSMPLNPTLGHHTMEREIQQILSEAPADLIPLRRVVNGRKPDAIWWISQAPSEAFLQEAIPTLELCRVSRITEIEGPRG